jgi:hypothetical protein
VKSNLVVLLESDLLRQLAEKAIESFEQFFDLMDTEQKAKVISFVKKHADSPRPSLRKKAKLFLSHWNS